MTKIIAVVTGGFSQEAAISFKSAQVVMQHLDAKKYQGILVKITREEGWIAEYDNKNYPINKADFSFNYSGRKINFDAAFISLHGTPGEDGLLQSYFDLINLPYNTCDALVAALTFNKILCNKVISTFDINVAKSFSFRKGDELKPKKIIKEVGLPCFVKPSCGGSSFGVTKVKTKEELEPAIEKALAVDNEVVIETFIEGIEVTCGLRSLNGAPQVLGITEIVSANDWFDYESKYNSASTQEITPARISDKLYKEISQISEKVYSSLRCRGFIRIDFILQKGKTPFLIEVNTVPGTSKESILPKMAAFSGVSLQDLFNYEVELTLARAQPMVRPTE